MTIDFGLEGERALITGAGQSVGEAIARIVLSDLTWAVVGRCAEARRWDLDTGHDLMITEPEKVTETVLAVAAHPGMAG